MYKPSGMNNTVVVESMTRYGQPFEWEVRHSCDDGQTNIMILNLQHILNGIPIFCQRCKKQIVIFYDNKIIDEAGIQNNWHDNYQQRVQRELYEFHKKMQEQQTRIF